MCLFYSPTGHSQRLGIPPVLLPLASPFGNSCHGTPIAPQCPLLLTHIPLPSLPSPNDPQSQPRATYKYNARSVHDVHAPARLAFPNSVMTASVSHSVTSRGPMPAGSGEPGAQSDAFPSQLCLLNIGSRGTAIFAFGVTIRG